MEIVVGRTSFSWEDSIALFGERRWLVEEGLCVREKRGALLALKMERPVLTQSGRGPRGISRWKDPF